MTLRNVCVHVVLTRCNLCSTDEADVQGFHTVCGNPEYAANPPADKDFKLVSLLRLLGAIPIGKTNTPYVRSLLYSSLHQSAYTVQENPKP